MKYAPTSEHVSRIPRRIRHLVLFGTVLAIQFAAFEAGLRVWGSSEAAPSFQGLFETDPRIGYRLKAGARVRFTTAEFDTEIAINNAGVRDDDSLGPKAPDERRILLLGDSLVLSVQVPQHETFGEVLEAQLNKLSDGSTYRVINAGVQGYGPVEEALLFETLGVALAPDLVLVVVFVGNDAEEAYRSVNRLDGDAAQAPALSDTIYTHLRRIVRRSMVLQIVRLRVYSVIERLGFRFAPPEPPLQSYAANPAPRVGEGLGIARRAVERIAADAGRLGARTAIVLMPARFQIDDGDYLRLKTAVAEAGGDLARHAATERFHAALAPVPLPVLDLLPVLQAAPAGPDLFFQANVHLTPRGHRVVAGALAEFVRERRLLEPDER